MNFKLEEWEENRIGDGVCNELFKNTKYKKIKQKKKDNLRQTLGGKVQKRKKDVHKLTTKLTHKNGKKQNKHESKLINIVNNDREYYQTPMFKNKRGVPDGNIKSNKILKSKVLNKKKHLKQKNNEIKKDVSKTYSDLPVLKLIKKQNNIPRDPQPSSKKIKASGTLRERMMHKLKAARFRYINEEIYTNQGQYAQKYFRSDPEAFSAYHEGYKQQLGRWQINPLDIIIESIRKMTKTTVIADFGCGEGKLGKSVEQKVHSFDLIAVDASITACDMKQVPLKTSSVDVVVFCLSLMGTNLKDYFLEANRVLKTGGMLKIAEVESRFDKVGIFIEGVERFGFKKIQSDLTHKIFYFIDFKKENDVKKKKKLPTIALRPCLYKKR